MHWQENSKCSPNACVLAHVFNPVVLGAAQLSIRVFCTPKQEWRSMKLGHKCGANVKGNFEPLTLNAMCEALFCKILPHDYQD